VKIPDEITERMLAYWDQTEGVEAVRPLIMVAPPGHEDHVNDCVAIATIVDGEPVIRVPWKPDEIDLAHLARGGTLWVSSHGGLFPHHLEVQEP
jgi:hypothetical protein